jgi:hypothetical protein
MLEESDSSQKIQKLIELNSSINNDYSDPKEQLQEILEAAMHLTSGESASILLANDGEVAAFVLKWPLAPRGLGGHGFYP